MIAFRPFRPEDLRAFALRQEQAALRPLLETPGYAEQLAQPHLAFTAWRVTRNGGNAVLGCGGIAPAGPARAYAWALVGHDVAAKDWLAITRQVRAVCRHAHARGFRRIEAHVLAEFRQGHRWMQVLGFVPVAFDEIFDGTRHHVQYVRIFPPTRLPVAGDIAVLARLAARYEALLREAIRGREDWSRAKTGVAA